MLEVPPHSHIFGRERAGPKKMWVLLGGLTVIYYMEEPPYLGTFVLTVDKTENVNVVSRYYFDLQNIPKILRRLLILGSITGIFYNRVDEKVDLLAVKGIGGLGAFENNSFTFM